MSDESITRHLEQPQVGTLKLSEAIRIGLTKIQENRMSYLTRHCGCAIGLAAVGFGQEPKATHWDTLFALVGKKTGLSLGFLKQVEDMHIHGTTAAEIADQLEAQGLSTPTAK